MFTGLVQEIGTVRSVNGGDKGKQIGIEMSNKVLVSTEIGASICCAGCCLSVTEKTKELLFFDVSAETLDKTALGAWGVGTRVNIEPSLRLGDEMGGHIVSGHVDTRAELSSIEKEGDSHRLTFFVPAEYMKYIAPKGSVAIDGISLTVNESEKTHFGVNIIPHTWKNTTISDRLIGDKLNLEVDTLARYVAHIIERRSGDVK
ncbi:MAG: riboflavin synthase [Alphaproteobacteria bacterium]